MKKYRVTEKHPFYKNGLIIEDYGYSFRKVNTSEGHVLEDRELDMKESLKHGWIEEIQAVEFTRNDMFAFGKWCINDYIRKHHCIDLELSFNKFIENKSNENKTGNDI